MQYELFLLYRFGPYVMEWETSMKPVQANSECVKIFKTMILFQPIYEVEPGEMTK